MSGPMSDMLAVAQALARSKEADDALKEALSKLTDNVVEQNSALADVVAALEAKRDSAPAIDYEALSKVFAAALAVALKHLPAPVVKVDVPTGPPHSPVTGIKPVRDASGVAEWYELTRK